MTRLAFTVLGVPRPQGSMKAVRLPTGQVGLKYSDRTYEWRRQIAAAAKAAHDGPPLTGPLHLTAVFVLPRPAGHYGTGRNAGKLKPGAPTWPSRIPDLDKLLRALDGVTDAGTIWGDDAQVARITAAKMYESPGDPPAARIIVETMDDTTLFASVPPLWVDVPVNGTLL